MKKSIVAALLALLALAASASAQTLAWDHTGTDVAYYRVQIDAATPINVGLAKTFTIPATPPLSRADHTFTVEACNALNLCASAGLTVKLPTAPGGVRFVFEQKTVKIGTTPAATDQILAPFYAQGWRIADYLVSSMVLLERPK